MVMVGVIWGLLSETTIPSIEAGGLFLWRQALRNPANTNADSNQQLISHTTKWSRNPLGHWDVLLDSCQVELEILVTLANGEQFSSFSVGFGLINDVILSCL